MTGYLAESVFQHYVTLFEDYTSGLIGAWLTAHPKGIVGLNAYENDEKSKNAERAVPLSFIIDNPDRESILRAVVDRELDHLKYRSLAASFDYLEKRAKSGVPTPGQIETLAEIKASRNILVHNRGIVNQTYLLKSGAKARYADGARIEISEPYLRDSWLLIAQVVGETSAAAIAKLAKPPAGGGAPGP